MQTIENGLYWVKIKFSTTGEFDYAMGEVINGHFRWVYRHECSPFIANTTIKELIANKTEMIKIEKPKIKY